MPALHNAKHELFAQARASGKGPSDAYVAAGFKLNSGNAGRLDRMPEVQARVAEILGKAAERAILTIYDIADQLDEDRKFARELEKPSAAVSATMGKARVLGLLVDKHEHTGKDGGPIEISEISEEEAARRIAFTLLRGVKAQEASTEH